MSGESYSLILLYVLYSLKTFSWFNDIPFSPRTHIEDKNERYDSFIGADSSQSKFMKYYNRFIGLAVNFSCYLNYTCSF